MPPLHVVALISGGKDSLFSILHCMRQGHVVVALANLHPREETDLDVDSFMYQTIGHNVVELIAGAIELPLYRQEIIGTARSTSKTYHDLTPREDGEQADEVESMHRLLRRIIISHPEVDAVSTGAILSDYQRTRVESVAIRLGLTPLSYLWQFPRLAPYDESALLRDMRFAGQDSRIIKVASGGLDDSFLWQNVADHRIIQRLEAAGGRFGTYGDGAVLGEGGEYETLTIDGPACLWKHRIAVEEQDLVTIPGSAGTAMTEIRRARLEDKDSDAQTMDLRSLRIPELFDTLFAGHSIDLTDLSALPRQMPSIGPDHINGARDGITKLSEITQETNTHITHCNLTGTGHSSERQIEDIMTRLTTAIVGGAACITHTTILLRSMEDFPAVNKMYASFFTTPDPPSRVTVACGSRLSAGVSVSLSAVAIQQSLVRQREGLHVQSRSYWAPANIGPYSQAISSESRNHSNDDERSSKIVYVAGQIPLVPATMEMHCPVDLPAVRIAFEQCLLSLQHLWRIGTAMNVNLWLGAIAFIGRDSVSHPADYVRAATKSWHDIHTDKRYQSNSDEDSDADFDVWHLQHGQGQTTSRGTRQSTYRDTSKRDCVPPVFVAEVQTLPRNAPIEWSSVGWHEPAATFSVKANSERAMTSYELCSSSSDEVIAGWVGVRTEEELSSMLRSDTHSNDQRAFTLYTTREVPLDVVADWKPLVVPCFGLWDQEGQQLYAVASFIHS